MLKNDAKLYIKKLNMLPKLTRQQKKKSKKQSLLFFSLLLTNIQIIRPLKLYNLTNISLNCTKCLKEFLSVFSKPKINLTLYKTYVKNPRILKILKPFYNLPLIKVCAANIWR